MAIIEETAAFMFQAQGNGVSFRKTLTLGRQSLYVDQMTLASLARKSNIDTAAASGSAEEYSEEFFRRFLKAEEITSLDYSDYEGADITHDMNLPIPDQLAEKYDAIIDGGTMEHVFNFPVAISNCMRMVKTGGRLFVFTPANNLMGHGFYQFSPELFFRVLCPDNGFEMERMIAVEFKHMSAEFGSFRTQYKVKDPDLIRSRVTLTNSHPVCLLIQARKIRHKSSPFEKYPQQSDYQRVWNTSSQEGNTAAGSSHRHISFLRRLTRLLPQRLRMILALQYYKYFTHSFRNRAAYVPLKSRK